jgi:hypothetical protein
MAVATETGYKLDERGVRSSSPVRRKNFLHFIHNGSGAQPNGGSSPEVRRPWREADLSTPTSAGVK